MTKEDFKNLIPNFSVVVFAKSNYIVADTKTQFGGNLVGIYDEFPKNEHIDWLNADSPSLTVNPNWNANMMKSINNVKEFGVQPDLPTQEEFHRQNILRKKTYG